MVKDSKSDNMTKTARLAFDAEVKTVHKVVKITLLGRPMGPGVCFPHGVVLGVALKSATWVPLENVSRLFEV